MAMPAEPWTEHDDSRLREQLERGNGKVSWAELTRLAFPEGKYTKQDCIERWRFLSKPKPLRGPWTKDEDAKLEGLVAQFGSEKWVVIAAEMGSRSGKQCRERWHNHLDPTINKGEWTTAEDEIIHQLYVKIGSRWAEMAKHLPGRPDNAIKNYWNATLVRNKRRRGGSISSLTGALDLSAGDSPPGMSRSTSSNSLSSSTGARYAPYTAATVRSPGMVKSRSESGSSFASLTGLSPLRRGSVDQFPQSFTSPYYSPGMSRSQSYQPVAAEFSSTPAGSRPFVFAPRDLSKEMNDPSRAGPYPYAVRDTPPTTPDRAPTYRRAHANSSPAAPAYPFATYSSPPSPAFSGQISGHAPQSSLDQVIDSSHAWSEVKHGAHQPARVSEDEFGDELGYETLQPVQQHLASGQYPTPHAQATQTQPSYFHSHSHSLDSYPAAPNGHHAHSNSLDSQHSAVSQHQYGAPHHLHHVASQDSFYGDSASASPYTEASPAPFVHPHHYPEVDEYGRPYPPPSEADQHALQHQTSAHFQHSADPLLSSGLPVYAPDGYYQPFRTTEDVKPVLSRQESNLSNASTRSSQSSYFAPTAAAARYEIDSLTNHTNSPRPSPVVDEANRTLGEVGAAAASPATSPTTTQALNPVA
ncbi:hypothetical protein RQP46_000718 [Phenoliferia psychrophenolica]